MGRQDLLSLTSELDVYYPSFANIFSIHGRQNLVSVWTSEERPMDVRFGIIYHSLTSPEHPGTSELKFIVWPESDLIHPSQFLMSKGHPGTSSCDIRFRRPGDVGI